MLGAPRSYLSRLIFSGLLLASNMRHTCADDTAGDSTSSSAALRAMSRSKLDADLLLAFQGKGSALAFDLGVVKRMARDLSAMTDDRVLVAGNSGGSILAVYFACFGFGDATIDRATEKIRAIDLAAIHGNEQLSAKMQRLLLNKHTELSNDALNEEIAFALGCDYHAGDNLEAIVARAHCRPRLPLLIVAANAEVLSNRRGASALTGRWEKRFDRDNYDVVWQNEVFDFYREHPQQFAAHAPDLRLGDSPRIGKAATYFVDRSMFELLRQIPVEQRLADLRLIDTPADLALAIRASSAEPTYFEPVVDPEPSKLLTDRVLGELGNTVRRSYCGGFVMPLPAQDARRMIPELYVLGTSSVPLPPSARKLVETWYLVDTQPLLYQCNWWCDLDTSPAEDDKRKIAAHHLSPDEEWQLGYATADGCLAKDAYVQGLVLQPKFTAPVAGRSEPLPLPTHRGLNALRFATSH